MSHVVGASRPELHVDLLLLIGHVLLIVHVHAHVEVPGRLRNRVGWENSTAERDCVRKIEKTFALKTWYE